jgi:hypothetical protein
MDVGYDLQMIAALWLWELLLIYRRFKYFKRHIMLYIMVMMIGFGHHQKS